MCGRIDQSQPIEHYLQQRAWPGLVNASAAEPKFNVAPGTFRPLLHRVDDHYQVDDLHWGYQAAWASGKIPVAINARLEKIGGKYWHPLLKSGRAIVPADGWYEWTGDKGVKQPWHIHRSDHAPLFMAALASFAPAGDNKASAGFTIVTADALGGMVDVHDRRPVVFSAADAALWLDPDLPAEAAEMLAREQALGPETFAWHAVSKAVGNVRNQGAALVAPLAEAAPVRDAAHRN
ncbi:putative SOS response-associated peptidase YedK [Actimicrobium sp. GrIS 1.19]|uniref:SOS response-associated peptidase family protein n=1 Tax=Actimicrobium sp. GrIS 1.19 TaxID=3071708 RepID=UPI002DFBF2D0|nr:putative SOS response-associated peptidase YedK [Actimicrobium sp. GrIS 1.19]